MIHDVVERVFEHVLVVSYHDGDEDPTYTVECPGVTDDCRMWVECRRAGCEAGLDDDFCSGDTAHGVEHRNLDSAWCTPTGWCFIADNENLGDAACDVADGLGPGRYPVRVNHENAMDDTELFLKLAREGGAR